MADSGSKDRGGHHALLVDFLVSGYFKIGFVGRKATKLSPRKTEEKKDLCGNYSFSLFPRVIYQVCMVGEQISIISCGLDVSHNY